MPDPFAPPPDPAFDLFWEVVERLDAAVDEVTEWEADFLESLLDRRARFPCPTSKQQAVLVRMAEQYLDAQTAAELRGQQRLL